MTYQLKQFPQPEHVAEVLGDWTFRPATLNNRKHWFVYEGADRSHSRAIVSQRLSGMYVVSCIGHASYPVATWDEAVLQVFECLGRRVE